MAAMTRAMSEQQEYTIECIHDGASNAFEMAQKLDEFRRSVQELTDTKSLPPVVLRRSDSKEEHSVNVRVRSRSGSTVASASDADVLCSGPDIERARQELLEKLGAGHSTLVFTTNEDRPGLLAEVTELIKLHGANILRAEVTSDSAVGSATHIYDVQDATTRRRLDKSTLERLEKSLSSLRDARSPVRRVARKASRDLGAEQLMFNQGVQSRLECGGSFSSASIKIVVPRAIEDDKDLKAPKLDPFAVAAEFGQLQHDLKEMATLTASPSIEISFGNVPQRVVEVWGQQRTGSSQVLARGADSDSLMAELQTRFGTTATIVFTSDCDRPGLLFEVTELIRQHGLNILKADVSTESGTGKASHTYHLEDAKRGRRPSVGTLKRLQADFDVLRRAPVDVRTLLAREGDQSDDEDVE
mmetsp:Transcript_83517/g.174745  ORF Transcript_83517/g.174745 Transcript_83517/m.174745 type:complete len:415 (-) Transcript_83517:32-1276(-)